MKGEEGSEGGTVDSAPATSDSFNECEIRWLHKSQTVPQNVAAATGAATATAAAWHANWPFGFAC